VRNILAIDPGKSGGMASFGWDSAEAFPMPDTPGDVIDAIRGFKFGESWNGTPFRLCPGETPIVYMEKVSGYAGGGGQPGSAMFRFGEGYGFIQGVVMTLGMRLELVTPQKWQKALGLGHREKTQSKCEWKNKLKAEAERLYPGVKVTLATADALLLLEYARRMS
jgi:hypothetical protein